MTGSHSPRAKPVINIHHAVQSVNFRQSIFASAEGVTGHGAVDSEGRCPGRLGRRIAGLVFRPDDC
jgi:hypothetical protein